MKAIDFKARIMSKILRSFNAKLKITASYKIYFTNLVNDDFFHNIRLRVESCLNFWQKDERGNSNRSSQ